MEVHRAKLKASYPHAADKIQMGGPQSADEIYARSTRVAISQGLPTLGEPLSPSFEPSSLRVLPGGRASSDRTRREST